MSPGFKLKTGALPLLNFQMSEKEVGDSVQEIFSIKKQRSYIAGKYGPGGNRGCWKCMSLCLCLCQISHQ